MDLLISRGKLSILAWSVYIGWAFSSYKQVNWDEIFSEIFSLC